MGKLISLKGKNGKKDSLTEAGRGQLRMEIIVFQLGMWASLALEAIKDILKQKDMGLITETEALVMVEKIIKEYKESQKQEK